jgi:hypothetical protein
MSSEIPYTLKTTTEQQHDFNIPYQLANLPEKEDLDKLIEKNKIKEVSELNIAMKANRLCKDSVKDADVLNHNLRLHDILILGTDGNSLIFNFIHL